MLNHSYADVQLSCCRNRSFPNAPSRNKRPQSRYNRTRATSLIRLGCTRAAA